VEDHGGSFFLPVFDPLFLSEFPDITPNEFTCLLDMAQLAEEKIESGQCAIVEREKWAEFCEERIQQDILALKKLINN